MNLVFTPIKPDRHHSSSALIAGIAAFVTWGLIPSYWEQIREVPASEILAHRYVWTSLFLTVLLTWQARWPEIKANARSRRALLFCLASGATISINWFTFIWAVNINRVIETSLGYFITPLVNVLLGAIFLRERLTRWQVVSVSLATLGVLNLTLGYGRFPWVALILCVTFGSYGLFRKKSGTAPIPGLFFETLMLLPVAIVYLLMLGFHGRLMFGHGGLRETLLLISTGVVTAVPLAWFGHAARHLRLTTVGFLQYLSPTGSLLLGIFACHESFTRAHLITFGLIWAGLAVFSAEAVLRWQSARVRQAVAESVNEPI